jgi:hypothetical protein
MKITGSCSLLPNFGLRIWNTSICCFKLVYTFPAALSIFMYPRFLIVHTRNKSLTNTLHALPHIRLTLTICVISKKKFIGAREFIVDCWIPDNNKISRTGKVGSNKLDISHLGRHYCAYQYFPEDSTYVVWFRKIVFVNYWSLFRIVIAVSYKLNISRFGV